MFCIGSFWGILEERIESQFTYGRNMLTVNFLRCMNSITRTRKFPKTEISPLAAYKGNLTAGQGRTLSLSW